MPRRTERRPVFPHRYSARGLANVAVKTEKGDVFDPKQTTILVEANPADPPPLRISVRLDLDPKELADQVLIPAKEIDLVLVEEQPHYRANRERWRAPILELPDEVEIPIERTGYGQRPFHLRAAAVLRVPRKRSRHGIAWRPGSLLAAKDFTFKAPASKSLFEVRIASFSENGWERNALWYCDFGDLDALATDPPEEALKVYLNGDHRALVELWKPAALRSPQRAPSAKIVRAFVFSGILAEIVLTALKAHHDRIGRDGGRIGDGIEEDSTLGRIRANFPSLLRRSFEELVEMAKSAPGELHRKLQDMAKAGDGVSEEVWDRIEGLAPIEEEGR